MESENKNMGLDPENQNLEFAQDEESNEDNDNIVIPSSDKEQPQIVERGVRVDAENHRLLCTDQFGIWHVISDELHVTKVFKNLDTNEVRVVLTHLTKWVNHEIEGTLNNFCSSKIFKFLTSNGVIVYENGTVALASYLMKQIDAYVDLNGFGYEHSRLGWGEYGQKSRILCLQIH